MDRGVLKMQTPESCLWGRWPRGIKGSFSGMFCDRHHNGRLVSEVGVNWLSQHRGRVPLSSQIMSSQPRYYSSIKSVGHLTIKRSGQRVIYIGQSCVCVCVCPWGLVVWSALQEDWLSNQSVFLRCTKTLVAFVIHHPFAPRSWFLCPQVSSR